MIVFLVIAFVFVLCPEANAKCHVFDHSRVSIIRQLGGKQTNGILRVYRSEGANCYVGDHGSSFGPFQLHYGGGMGDTFTRQTGLSARNPSTVPAQIAFMRRWGNSHGGFSSGIWHGLRHHNVGHGLRLRRHLHHWRHHWQHHHLKRRP